MGVCFEFDLHLSTSHLHHLRIQKSVRLGKKKVIQNFTKSSRISLGYKKEPSDIPDGMLVNTRMRALRFRGKATSD